MANNKREGENDDMTEYEKQRLLRIRENKARLEALGLPALAAASVFSTQDQVNKGKNKKKKKKNEDDEEDEYQPSDEDDEEEDQEEAVKDRSSEEKIHSCSNSTRKGKSSISSHEVKLSKVSRLKRRRKVGDFDDDDAALAQAISLSLGEAVENENGGANIQNKGDEIRKSNTTTKELKRANKKLSKSRIQLSEEEVIGFFFSFDEVGKGYITAYDIEKMAVAHDFTWTDGELAKMVRCFDSDGDRKLNLEDFRSIVSRCHMLQESE